MANGIPTAGIGGFIDRIRETPTASISGFIDRIKETGIPFADILSPVLGAIGGPTPGQISFGDVIAPFINPATTPISLVNVLAGAFGGRRDFMEDISASIDKGALDVIGKQKGIFERAGKQDTQIYRALEETEKYINENTGIPENIIPLRDSFLAVINEAQNFIRPIPEEFSFTDLRPGAGRREAAQGPTADTGIGGESRAPFNRISQFIDILEGKAPKVPVNVATGPGAARRKPRIELQPIGKGIEPLDIEAIRGTDIPVSQPPQQEPPPPQERPSPVIPPTGGLGDIFSGFLGGPEGFRPPPVAPPTVTSPPSVGQVAPLPGIGAPSAGQVAVAPGPTPPAQLPPVQVTPPPPEVSQVAPLPRAGAPSVGQVAVASGPTPVFEAPVPVPEISPIPAPEPVPVTEPVQAPQIQDVIEQPTIEQVTQQTQPQVQQQQPTTQAPPEPEPIPDAVQRDPAFDPAFDNILRILNIIRPISDIFRRPSGGIGDIFLPPGFIMPNQFGFPIVPAQQIGLFGQEAGIEGESDIEALRRRAGVPFSPTLGDVFELGAGPIGTAPFI